MTGGTRMSPGRSAVSAAPSRDRLPSLTGLRFWAALVVVLYHLSRATGKIPGLSDAVWYGRTGVTFFFVLSGFVLAWTYDGAGVPAKVFMWRRFARIWPLMLVTTALSVAVIAVQGDAVSRAAVTTSLFLLHAWVPDPVYAAAGNPAAWSLSDEAFFYAVFPLLLAALTRGRARSWAWTAVACCTALVLVWPAASTASDTFHRVWALDYFPVSRSLQFVVGVTAGLAVKRGWRPRVSLPAAAGLVVAWHLLLIPWSRAVPDALWYSPYSASQLLSTPLFALLVVAAARADLDGRRTGLGGTWMIRLGHWSFAWYLMHEIVIRGVKGLYGRPGSLSETVEVWTLVLTVSLALSAAAYQWIERPAERMLRGLGPRHAPPGGDHRPHAPTEAVRPGFTAPDREEETK
ncbi:acyltransferase family protein [Streptomyces sp. NPDC086080]|uniref:acyltransferase family protein n=1 Tax=Streptomyces sp. NPDC086080 TaxID=3365748 RepID=UPI0037D038BC